MICGIKSLKINSKAVLFNLLVSLPVVVYAEVSDKIPTIASLWTQAIILAILSFVTSYIRWWTPLVFIPFSFIFSWSSAAIVTDPHVGPAIIAEQGNIYGVSAIGAALIIIIGQGLGIWRGLREWKKLKTPT